MRLIKQAVFVTLMSFSYYAHADAVAVQLSSFSLWSSWSGGDFVRVRTTDQIANPNNCSSPDSYVLDPAMEPSAISRSYSTLMAAYMSNKPVTVVVEGCALNVPAINTVILD